MQCVESVYAYSYVRKTGDAGVISLGERSNHSARSTSRLTTAESVKQGKVRIEGGGSQTASQDVQQPAFVASGTASVFAYTLARVPSRL